jgi:hypothetical protein
MAVPIATNPIYIATSNLRKLWQDELYTTPSAINEDFQREIVKVTAYYKKYIKIILVILDKYLTLWSHTSTSPLYKIQTEQLAELKNEYLKYTPLTDELKLRICMLKCFTDPPEPALEWWRKYDKIN